MSTPAVVLLAEVYSCSKTQVGLGANELGVLHHHHIPQPPLFVIPRESLAQVATTNNLTRKVELLLNTEHSRKVREEKLHSLITRQHWPESLGTEIAKKYLGYCKQGLVTIFPSLLTHGTSSVKEKSVHGEAAVLESILQVWADTVIEQQSYTHTTKPTLEKILPAAMCVQKQPLATVSGFGFTRHPLSGDKTIALIQSVWGSVDGPLPTASGDTYEVDIRTYSTRRKNIRPQEIQLKLVPGGVETIAVPKEKQSAETLTPTQLERLARLMYSIKQKRLHHYRIQWCIEQNSIFCVSIEELAPTHTKPTPVTTALTKVYVQVNRPQSLTEELISEIDGVGALMPEYTLAAFGKHPLAAINGRYKQLLQKQLLALLTKSHAALGNLPMVYRSQNFTSSELREFTEFQKYEPVEPNPYLGIRGALKTMLNPDLFQFELEVLATFQKKANTQLGILFPCVRTPTELTRLVQLTEQSSLRDDNKTQLWFELSTPENVFFLADYPLQKLAGVYLNVESLQSLMLGIDPTNPEMVNYYQPPFGQFDVLMKQTAAALQQVATTQGLRHPPRLRVLLKHYNTRIVEQAVRHGAEAVIVKPQAASLAKISIMEAESRPLKG
jgi:phosphoenolpyruvate synthase/pyruvate phosphate dikinase